MRRTALTETPRPSASPRSRAPPATKPGLATNSSAYALQMIGPGLADVVKQKLDDSDVPMDLPMSLDAARRTSPTGYPPKNKNTTH